MILTKAKAAKNIGRWIDCYSRIGIYPKQIVVDKLGEVKLMCRLSGVLHPIEDNGFNVTHYDYMFDMVEDASTPGKALHTEMTNSLESITDEDIKNAVLGLEDSRGVIKRGVYSQDTATTEMVARMLHGHTLAIQTLNSYRKLRQLAEDTPNGGKQ